PPTLSCSLPLHDALPISAKIKEMLDDVYKGATTGSDTGGQTVSVVADERTNAVVVAAPPGELSNVETIIGRLDQADLTGVVEVRSEEHTSELQSLTNLLC